MTKILWILAAAVFAVVSAQAATREEAFMALKATAIETCQIPAKLHPYSAASLDAYLLQVVDPQWRVIDTSFMRAFTFPNSDYLPIGYCIALFMNQPKDPLWEGPDFAHRLYKSALSYSNAIPSIMLDGLDAESGMPKFRAFTLPTL